MVIIEVPADCSERQEVDQTVFVFQPSLVLTETCNPQLLVWIR